MRKRMLVPLDGSKLAEEVFFHAEDLAVSQDLNLILLNVAKPSEASSLDVNRDYIGARVEFIGRKLIEAQKSTKSESGGNAIEVTGEVVVGYPADEIIRYASENRIDFILIAAHEHTRFTHWVRRSVADKVLQASQVPVWLIKASDLEEYVYAK